MCCKFRVKFFRLSSKVASMLTLSAQSEIVSLVNDFHDQSIRNDVSYGSHKVRESVCKWWWLLHRSSTCCVILKIELELEYLHSHRGEMWRTFLFVILPAGKILPLKIFERCCGKFCDKFSWQIRFWGISADSIVWKFRKL